MAHNNNDSESTVNFTVLPPVSHSGQHQRLCPSVVVHRTLKCTEQLNSFFFVCAFTDNLFRSPRLLLICDQQDAPRSCEQDHCSAVIQSHACWFASWEKQQDVFGAAVGPQRSAVSSAYLVFIFLMIARIILSYQGWVFTEKQQEFVDELEAFSPPSTFPLDVVNVDFLIGPSPNKKSIQESI